MSTHKRKSQIKLKPGLFRRLTAKWRQDPDFLIVGTQKGGTSTLYHILSKHPQISVPLKKEVHFFDTNYQNGYRWYRGFMPLRSKSKLAFEATPYYLYHPLSPERIAKHLPNVKVIILLRDPVKRAYSHYQMQKDQGREELTSFEDAIDAEASRLNGEEDKISNLPTYNSPTFARYSYLNRGMYHKQIQRWLTHFKRDQLLILKSEQFYSSTSSELEKVAEFLEIANKFELGDIIQNAREYAPLPKNIKLKVSEHFKADSKKLKALLGEMFEWNS